ncbi:hypothetical protein [Azohydromonas australica]|uniref:hypothetical protein n=1 Tax=Azohydromonas australica TaxID=364039 RepID=UPI00041C403F|nr:hypothetical protein [Azohydromonas australica]
MPSTEAIALGMAVFGALAAVAGIAGFMDHRRRTGVMLLWCGIAAIGAACVLLVVMPY